MPKPSHSALRGAPFPQRPISRYIPLLGHGERDYTLADLPHPSTLPRSLAVHPDFYAQHLSPEGNPALHTLLNNPDFLPRRIAGFGSAVRCWTRQQFPEARHPAADHVRPHRSGTRFITHHRTVVAAFFTGADGINYAYLHYGISRKTDEVVRACDTGFIVFAPSIERGVVRALPPAGDAHIYSDGPLVIAQNDAPQSQAAHPDTTLTTINPTKPDPTDRRPLPRHIPRLVLPEPYVAISGRPALSRPDNLLLRVPIYIVPPGIGAQPHWSRHDAVEDKIYALRPLTYTRDELEAAAHDALVEVLDPRVTPLAHAIHHKLREYRTIPSADALLYGFPSYSQAPRTHLHMLALSLLRPDTLRPRTYHARVKSVLAALRREGTHLPAFIGGLIDLHGIPFVKE